MEKNCRSEALAYVLKEAAKDAAKIERFADQVEQLETAMDRVFVRNEWNLRFAASFTIKSKDLPAIRKAVGRLRIDGKSLAYDYDKTGEVIIRLKPIAKEFDLLSFNYRRKFRNGGNCKVVEQTSKYQTLVCAKQ